MDPTLILTLVSQGLNLWADYADRAAKGELTEADLDAMAEHLNVNIEGLRDDIARARAAEPAEKAAAKK